MNSHSTHESDIDRFYHLLDVLEHGLGGKRYFKDIDKYSDWPERGIYFVFEKNETRPSAKALSSRESMRVTRIGTHAIQNHAETTLLGRLKAHRGYIRGGGNHRGSVFRRHIGNALLNVPGCDLSVPTWNSEKVNQEERKVERELELRVSDCVGDMQILWLGIADGPSRESGRSFIEANSIALLTYGTTVINVPSKSWLGNNSPEPEIRGSGLWNKQHVGRPYEGRFIDILEDYVQITIRKKRETNVSLVTEPI